MNDMIADIIQYMDDYIKNKTNGKNKLFSTDPVRANIYRKELESSIKNILRKSELIYQNSESCNLLEFNSNLMRLVKLSVQDDGGNSYDFDINLIVGQLISKQFHEILTQYRLLLIDSGLTFRNMILSFDEPDHLFGIPLPRGDDNHIRSVIHNWYGNRLFTSFRYPGNNEIIRNIFGDDNDKYPMDRIELIPRYANLKKAYALLTERSENDESLKDNLLSYLLDPEISLADFFDVYLPYYLSNLEIDGISEGNKLIITNDDLLILGRYLEKASEGCVDDEAAKKKIAEKIENVDFELLVEARNSLYLNDNFLKDLWALIVFLKNSSQDEFWFNEISDQPNGILFRGREGDFCELICEFYKKYSYYFPVDSFKDEDIKKISKRLYTILDNKSFDGSSSLSFFVKNTFAKSLPNSLPESNDDRCRYIRTLVKSIFCNLNDYTKAMFYSDYKIYEFLNNIRDGIVSNWGDVHDIYAFDLLLSNSLIEQYQRNPLESRPNFIKIFYKLGNIKKILDLIKENIYRMRFKECVAEVTTSHSDKPSFMGLRYELYPIDVTFGGHKASAGNFQVIQFCDEKLQIVVSKSGDIWKVVSNRSGRVSNKKSAVIKGGKYNA